MSSNEFEEIEVLTEVEDENGNLVTDDLVALVDSDGNILATDETIVVETADGDVLIDEVVSVADENGELVAVAEEIDVYTEDDED